MKIKALLHSWSIRQAQDPEHIEGKIKNWSLKISDWFVTNFKRLPEISETRDISTPTDRDTRLPAPEGAADGGQVTPKKLVMESLCCPYCQSTTFVKKGIRRKKRENVQLFLCLSCHKVFTPRATKGKHYPLPIMLDAISIYNLGYSLDQTCRIVAERHQKTPLSGAIGDSTQGESNLDYHLAGNISHINLQASTLSAWITETEELCRFCRMREFAMKRFSPKEMVITATLAHRQLYRYRFHRGKCDLIIQEEYGHRKFAPLKEFLEMVPAECPHQYFTQGLRASEAPLAFSKTAMIVRGKTNYATRLAAFVLQSVDDRKQRHEAIQKFMLANDSVTVATEVPVYLTRDDIEHMKSQLGFEIYDKETMASLLNCSIVKDAENNETMKQCNNLPRLITGHIDLLQIRNGQIHILDYKPNAEKERPIEQLTLYAMALSRLTGLRLFEFKCAWFDEKDYFEFYPLHVLHKPKKAQRRRNVMTQEGTYAVNRNEKKVEAVRPITL